MKRACTILLALALWSGCAQRPYTLTPQDHRDISRMAIISHVLAESAKRGGMKEIDMVIALNAHAGAWQGFLKRTQRDR